MGGHRGMWTGERKMWPGRGSVLTVTVVSLSIQLSLQNLVNTHAHPSLSLRPRGGASSTSGSPGVLRPLWFSPPLPTHLQLPHLSVPPASCRDPGWHADKRERTQVLRWVLDAFRWSPRLPSHSSHNGSVQNENTKSSYHYVQMEVKST